MRIGLLMVNQENDILEYTLKRHEQIVDCFYVLDGTLPASFSRLVCESSRKCAGYWTDAELPRPPYPHAPRDGYRQFLLERAVTDHGTDNLFLLLHADEVWTTDPQAVLDEHPGCDGFGFRLPFFVPRAEDGWDYRTHPVEQLRWLLSPGYPEFRMFLGNPDVQFDPAQHSNVTPSGIRKLGMTPTRILHYPYRSPAQQQLRAGATWDPANYTRPGLWDDQRIADYQQQEYWVTLEEVTVGDTASPV